MPRPRLTAAVLLTAALSTAAVTGGAATAHPAGVHTRAAATPVTPDVTVTGTKTTLTVSTTTITPGPTVFSVSAPGSVEIVSFNSGYSVSDLIKDGQKLFRGDVKVVRRVDKKVNLWGGLQKKGEFAVDLPAGSYYVVNLDKGLSQPLTVSGATSTRVMPASGGTVKMVKDMTFKADAKLPASGWITMNNKASEPHFVDFLKVKNGTTAATVRSFLLHGAAGNPPWALNEFHESLVVSPGHSFEYLMDATKGEYVEVCFWPSKKTGMPHALMGMFDISKLK